MCGSFPGLLIGRTAVHSGKDPAFVAYDQFLSTGILQPLSRGEVRCGSRTEDLDLSISGPLLPSKADVRADLPGGRVRANGGHCCHSPNGTLWNIRRPHSGLMFAARTTLPHFSVYWTM